jgi:hypothetical protein
MGKAHGPKIKKVGVQGFSGPQKWAEAPGVKFRVWTQ